MSHEDVDIDALTIDELRAALRKAGLQNGPITSSTEAVYRASLLKYLVSLEYENKETLQLNSSNPDAEYIDSRSESEVEGDLDRDEASEIPVHQAQTNYSTMPSYNPIRWNPELQRYETIYGGSGGVLTNKGDETHSKDTGKWLLLVAAAVIFLAIVAAMMFLSGERDPYKELADAASRIVARGKGPAEQ